MFDEDNNKKGADNGQKKPPGGGFKISSMTLLAWAAIITATVALFMMKQHYTTPATQLTQSEFLTMFHTNQIAHATINMSGQTSQLTPISGTYYRADKDGKLTKEEVPFIAPNILLTQKMLDELLPSDRIEAGAPNAMLMSVVWGIAPFLILGALFWFFFIRQIKIAGKGALSFGKSKARMLAKDRNKTTFKDVAGVDEAIEEVSELVEFLKDPKKFQRLGGRIPKGVLMVGSPGTGKTLLAKAIAGEADASFFSISGSDFVEMFVGVGASRVRDMFEQARKTTPCLIFIDEIDAVGRSRGHGLGGGNDEREQTLNALLVEMDGFDTQEGIIIIAATNRPDVLDPALLRPGRFDRQVTVSLPDVRGREAILKVHAKNVKLATDVDLSVIARGTPGYSGAELANLLNEAALLAARTSKKSIGMVELEEARDKVRSAGARASRDCPPARGFLGSGSHLDVLRAEQDTDAARAAVVSGDETTRQNREALGIALGLAEAVGAAPGINIDGLVKDTGTGCKLVGTIDDRADLRASRMQVDIAARGEKDVWYQFSPTVTFLSTLAASNDALAIPSTTWNVQGILSIPLWDLGALRRASPGAGSEG